MTPVRFYRIALLIPLLLPLTLLPFEIGAVFFMALAFGGVQYIVFAAALFIVIGRLKSTEKIQRLALWAPVLFVPVQVLGWVSFGYIERLANPDLAGVWEALPIFVVWVLVLGYMYVGLVALIFRLSKFAGFLKPNAL